MVFLSHGFGSSAVLMEHKAKSFAMSGIASVIFDFRGGSHKSKSDGKYHGDVLIFHGTKDPAVNISYSIKGDQTYQNSELFVVEGAGHGFSGDEEQSVLKTVYHFIKKH